MKHDRVCAASVLPFAALFFLHAACSATIHKGEFPGDEDMAVEIADGDTDDAGTDDAGNSPCLPNMGDQIGCSCTLDTPMRACWPSTADAKARSVGACRDGKQLCMMGGEFSTWAKCSGATLPTKEVCNDKIDNDCNGLLDCKDPSCATSPFCATGCTNGQTRACYDGPAGTQNVGTCKGGMQTCTNAAWPNNCPGETLPTAEVCSDGLDHNCNHLPGCLDLFSCVLDPACQPKCKVDQGCVCPMGNGETATCPDGYHGITQGAGIFSAGTVECCPCSANDCGDPECCGEKVCQGNKKCGPFTCNKLPQNCNGRVGFDCDDFTEDCDVMCCKCTMGCK